MTEFPCIFPCAWHGQTFDIYEYLGNFKTTWTFNSGGQTSVFTDQTNNSVTYRCHQIMERFLILREEGLDNFICLQIIYDLAKPLEFILGSSLNDSPHILVNQTGEITNMCGICGDSNVGKAVAIPIGSFGCIKPSTCSSRACNMNDIIPKECPITTTENLTTTVKTTTTIPEITSPPESTKTTKSQCVKKNHNHNST
ncbi:uncharacterized protein LOC143046900 isoform X2 [Mytilus galloprovincialis]|uniref:uncharacterized protein LOC143046900 isoform X2 n=1 Tax=Mytilus galloprovincialis TaxID=29158 RepID=UPI003F7BF99B